MENSCTYIFSIFLISFVSFIFYSYEATIISGRKLAAQVCEEIQRDVESWLALGNKRPHLTVVLVGENPASHIYVRNKVKAAAAVGMPYLLSKVAINKVNGLDATCKHFLMYQTFC